MQRKQQTYVLTVPRRLRVRGSVCHLDGWPLPPRPSQGRPSERVGVLISSNKDTSPTGYGGHPHDLILPQSPLWVQSHSEVLGVRTPTRIWGLSSAPDSPVGHHCFSVIWVRANTSPVRALRASPCFVNQLVADSHTLQPACQALAGRQSPGCVSICDQHMETSTAAVQMRSCCLRGGRLGPHRVCL